MFKSKKPMNLIFHKVFYKNNFFISKTTHKFQRYFSTMQIKSLKDRYARPFCCDHIVSIHHEKQLIPLESGNLFLSGYDGLHEDIINYYKIGSVLTIMDDYTYKSYKIPTKITKLGIDPKNHKWIDMQDSVADSIDPFFKQSNSFIQQKLQQANVLVHCLMGVSRSASLVIAFLMSHFKMSFEEAYKHTKSMRAVNPNDTFLKNLKRYQIDLEYQNSVNNENNKNNKQSQKKQV